MATEGRDDRNERSRDAFQADHNDARHVLKASPVRR